MTKEKKTYTLEPSVVRKIERLSNESYRMTGRHMSMSEVIENLVNKAFVSKKDQLNQRLMELDKQRNAVADELEMLVDRQKMQEMELMN